MEITTIAIPKPLKEDIQEFGHKGETYTEIIIRLLESAKERQLQDLLMSEEDCVTVREALKEAEEKWPE